MNAEINVTLEELRRKRESLLDFQTNVLNNIKMNFTKINTTAGRILNEEKYFVESLKKQTAGLSLTFSHF